MPLVLFTLMAGGCGGRPANLRPSVDSPVELSATPFFAQQRYQCGPAALATILSASGLGIGPDELAGEVYLPGREGSLQLELVAACRRMGRVAFVLPPRLNAIEAELLRGRPVLVLQNLGLNSAPSYHYAVVVGIRPEGTVILRSGRTRRKEMALATFLMSWTRPGAWAMVALRPGELPGAEEPGRVLEAIAAFEAVGHAGPALLSYQAANRRWPDHPGLLFGLATGQLEAGRLNSALANYRQLLRLRPNHLAAANNLAETLLRLGCRAQAKEVAERALHTARRQRSPLLTHLETSLLEMEQGARGIHPPAPVSPCPTLPENALPPPDGGRSLAGDATDRKGEDDEHRMHSRRFRQQPGGDGDL